MHLLFELPPELVELIFEHIVTSRLFERVMRLRIVNRQFKTYIDHSIFRLSLLSQLIDYPYYIERLSWSHRSTPTQQAFRAYVHSYITYHILREKSTTSPLGRVRRAARILCETDDDAGNEAVLAGIDSLVRVAMSTGRLGTLLLKPRTGQPEKCSDQDLTADLCVAAICLGKQSYVESRIADGIDFCGVAGRRDVHSTVFGDAFYAAMVRGDVSMIDLLLSCIAEYRETGILSRPKQREILVSAMMHGHQALFDFALDRRPINLPETELERTTHVDVRMLKNAIRIAPSLQNYERLAAMLGPASAAFEDRDHEGTRSLQRSAHFNNEDMIRYFLNKGAKPNYSGPAPIYSPLLSAIKHNNETIIKLLLEAGADPNLPAPPDSPLMCAVWKGSMFVAKMLLSRVRDVNEGCPPPIVIAVFKERMDMFHLLREHGARLDTPETGGWAMAVAKLNGFSSMVDVLVREGVGQDVVLHWVAPYIEERWWYRRLWSRPHRYW
ncbi:ankyrin [Xylaria cf. heliscus]|nr:ankyrin [Xylaria cf. heliscus]